MKYSIFLSENTKINERKKIEIKHESVIYEIMDPDSLFFVGI